MRFYFILIIIFLTPLFLVYTILIRKNQGMSYDEKIVLFIDHNDWLFDLIESWKYGIWISKEFSWTTTDGNLYSFSIFVFLLQKLSKTKLCQRSVGTVFRTYYFYLKN